MFIFILECAAVGQADGRHIGMRDCFREERSVELDEGDVIIASVQQLRIVSLVNYNCFCAPINNNFFIRKNLVKTRILLHFNTNVTIRNISCSCKYQGCAGRSTFQQRGAGRGGARIKIRGAG